MTLREAGQDIVDLNYRLHDAITKADGRVFASGTQALVRMLGMQRLTDRRDGIHSAGFISGYRGSPLASVDTEAWRAKAALVAHDIKFLPAVNEDLAATAVSGTQRVGDDPARTVDGVCALWYGKGPGVDRAGDAIRHGHAAGASAKGGVLLVVGDDHAATSSSIPNASDLSLMGWSIPIIHPAGVDEYVAFGLWGGQPRVFPAPGSPSRRFRKPSRAAAVLSMPRCLASNCHRRRAFHPMASPTARVTS